MRAGTAVDVFAEKNYGFEYYFLNPGPGWREAEKIKGMSWALPGLPQFPATQSRSWYNACD